MTNKSYSLYQLADWWCRHGIHPLPAQGPGQRDDASSEAGEAGSARPDRTHTTTPRRYLPPIGSAMGWS